MRRFLIIGCITLLSGLSGCALLDGTLCVYSCGSQSSRSSSLVGFLYPRGERPPQDTSIPELRVPLRVGLAFLPSSGLNGALDESQKQELLEKIRQRFSSRPFVREIVIVPDYYLQGQRGFEGLQGVQRLYDIDLIALVSYDQVTHQDNNSLSLGYMTIVGAYVLKGNRHDISTLVDLAVVDPSTRSLVLRAGGVEQRQGSASLINASHDSRADAQAAFTAATDRLIANFDSELTRFEADVRAGRANVRVVKRTAASSGASPSGGGGAFDWKWLALLLPIAAARVMRSLRATSA